MPGKNVRIGVATTVVPRRRTVQGREVFRPALHFCRMAQHARAYGASMILFDPLDLNWNQNTVSAWQPKDTSQPFGDWVRTTAPIPESIYENVFVHLAQAGRSYKMRQTAKQRKIAVFNPALPSKWQMVQWMKKAGLTKYLPQTTYLQDVGNAMGLIDDWGMAYVKPIGGYGGKGVMRVERWGAAKYRISVDRQANGGRQRSVVNQAELAKFLKRRKTVPHIVQKGIRLLTVDGRKVDFRVVVQRGVDGTWNHIGIVPKLAAADGVVTNIIAGGERMSMGQLEALAQRQGKRIPTAELTQCALAIASKISETHRLTGILGFDLGVDENGRVWMIEANPKPARSLLTDEMKQTVAKHAAGFAVYLARQKG